MNKIHDLEINEIVAQSIRIDELQINEEYKRAPGDIAYWNTQKSKALKNYMLKDLQEKLIEARLYIEHRTRLESFGNMKVTEAMVSTQVLLDEEMHAHKLATIDAKVEYERIRGIAEAVIAKKDVLQSLGANLRQEMAGDPLLRDQVAYRRKTEK